MYLIGLSVNLEDHAVRFAEDLARYRNASRLAQVIRTLRAPKRKRICFFSCLFEI